jgi:hypothetical protein
MCPATPTHPDKTPVAADLFTYCTKEKTETWHVVRNHDAKGIVERVICKSCGSEHRYKKAESTLSSSRVVVKRAPSSSPKSTEDAQASWFRGIKKWGDRAPLSFDPAQSFSVGDVVEHAVFGKGVVQTRRENKVDVLFNSGTKTLPSKMPSRA